MKFLYALITLSFLLGVSLQTDPTPALAQAEPNALYLLTESDTAFTVNALNPADGSRVVLFSVPTSEQGVLSEHFPAAEIDALNLYLPTYNSFAPYPVRSLSELFVRGRIDSITVSPDNRQVVAKVVYQTCFVPQNPVCFGTTQLVLIDRTNRLQRVLFNLGLHDDGFTQSDYFDTNPETHIGYVEWMPNQQSVLIAISNRGTRRNLAASALVIVPVNESNPYKIGEGLTWTASPEGEQVVILDKFTPGYRGLPNTLHIVDLNVQTGQFSQSTHLLENYVIDGPAGLALLDHFVIFSNAFDPRFTETTQTGGGLAVFDTRTGEASMLLPGQITRKIQATPDASRLVLETGEHLLVEARLTDGAITIEPLLDLPVVDWKLGSDGSLAVRYAENDGYQLLSADGRRTETLSSAASIEEMGEILMVDW